MHLKAHLNRRTLLPWLAGIALFGFWLCYSFAVQGYENDIFWQLKTGLLNLQTHRLNEVDLFSWTAHSKYWFNQEWLGQIVLAALYQLGGLSLVKLFWWILLALQFGMLWFVFVRARSGVALGAFFSLVICFLLGTINMLPRMQSFSLLGMGLTAIVLLRWWQERQVGPYLYPVAIALWANLHGGGAIAGPASLTLVLLTEALLRHLQRKPLELRPLAILTGLSWLALLINPHHLQLLAYSFASLTNPDSRAMQLIIREWQPFSLALDDSWLYLAWAASLGLAWAASPFRRELEPKLPMLVFWLAWAMMAMHAVRFLPFAMIASAPLMGTLAAEVSRPRDKRDWLPRACQVAIVGVFSVLLVLPRALQLQGGIIPAGNAFPSERALRAVAADASHSRLFNLYDWGGILIFACYPAVQVFIDGRQYLYGRKLCADHQTIKHARVGWNALLASYGIDRVFVPPTVELAGELRRSPAWRIAFEDASAILFVKGLLVRP